jgi:hypothetical protein
MLTLNYHLESNKVKQHGLRHLNKVFKYRKIKIQFKKNLRIFSIYRIVKI